MCTSCWDLSERKMIPHTLVYVMWKVVFLRFVCAIVPHNLQNAILYLYSNKFLSCLVLSCLFLSFLVLSCAFWLSYGNQQGRQLLEMFPAKTFVDKHEAFSKTIWTFVINRPALQHCTCCNQEHTKKKRCDTKCVLTHQQSWAATLAVASGWKPRMETVWLLTVV